MAEPDNEDDEVDATYIWGTNLSVNKVQSRFSSFVHGFSLPGEAQPKYLQLLQEVRLPWPQWGR